MFNSPSRPRAPSAATLRVLYQLAYISSGTALGVGALCAEERRRRLAVIQRIADNSRRIKLCSRYQHGAAAALLQEFAEGTATDYHRKAYLRGQEDAVLAADLPSVVAREYDRTRGLQEVNTARGKARQATSMEMMESPRSRRRSKGQPMVVERSNSSRASFGMGYAETARTTHDRRTQRAAVQEHMSAEASPSDVLAIGNDRWRSSRSARNATTSAENASALEALQALSTPTLPDTESSRTLKYSGPFGIMVDELAGVSLDEITLTNGHHQWNETSVVRERPIQPATPEFQAYGGLTTGSYTSADSARLSTPVQPHQVLEHNANFRTEHLWQSPVTTALVTTADLEVDIDLLVKFTQESVPKAYRLDSQRAEDIFDGLFKLATVAGSIHAIADLLTWQGRNGKASLTSLMLTARSWNRLSSTASKEQIARLLSDQFATVAASKRADLLPAAVELSVRFLRRFKKTREQSAAATFAPLSYAIGHRDFSQAAEPICTALMAKGELWTAVLLATSSSADVWTASVLEDLAGRLFRQAILDEMPNACLKLVKWTKGSIHFHTKRAGGFAKYVKLCSKLRAFNRIVAPFNDATYATASNARELKAMLNAGTLSTDTVRELVKAFVRTDSTDSPLFDALCEHLPESAQVTIQRTIVETRAQHLISEWRRTRNADKVLELYLEFVRHKGRTQELMALHTYMARIAIEAGRPDLVRRMIDTISSQDSSISSTLLGALILAREKQWSSLQSLLCRPTSTPSVSVKSDSQAQGLLATVLNLFAADHSSEETLHFCNAVLKAHTLKPGRRVTVVMLSKFVTDQKLDLVEAWLKARRQDGSLDKVDGLLAAQLLRVLCQSTKANHVWLLEQTADLVALESDLATKEMRAMLVQMVAAGLRKDRSRYAGQRRLQDEERLQNLLSGRLLGPNAQVEPLPTNTAEILANSAAKHDVHPTEDSSRQLVTAQAELDEHHIPQDSNAVVNRSTVPTEDLALVNRNPVSTHAAYTNGHVQHQADKPAAVPPTPSRGKGAYALFTEDAIGQHPMLFSWSDSSVGAFRATSVMQMPQSPGVMSVADDLSDSSLLELHGGIYQPTTTSVTNDREFEQTDSLFDEEPILAADFNKLRPGHRNMLDGGMVDSRPDMYGLPLHAHMLAAFSVGDYGRALSILDESNAPPSSLALEIAIESSLRLRAGRSEEALELIALAKRDGVAVELAMGPVLLHRIRNSPLQDDHSAIDICREVTRFYRRNAAAGLPLTTHLLAATAHKLIQTSRHVKRGITLLENFRHTASTRHIPFDLPTLTTAMVGYARLKDLDGVETIVTEVLDRALQIDSLFIVKLRDIKWHFRSATSTPGNGKTPHIARLDRLRTQCITRRDQQRTTTVKFSRGLVQLLARHANATWDVDSPLRKRIDVNRPLAGHGKRRTSAIEVLA